MFAQSRTDSVAISIDTLNVKPSYIPTGLRVGTDLISLIKTPLSDQFDGWEVNVDVDFYRYYFTVDVGSWSKTFSSESQNYSNTGTYWRVGADVNLMLKDPDRNMFFLGLRYAQSSFSEQLNYQFQDPVFGDGVRNLANPSASARWAEITLGLRAKIWKQFWMGYTARLKIAPGIKGAEQFEVYDIPGYGLASKDTYWGFNYQVYYRIPFKR